PAMRRSARWRWMCWSSDPDDGVRRSGVFMNKNNGKMEAGERPGRGTLGIHLDSDAVRVVEVIHGSMSGWSRFPYPPGVSPASPDFPAFLKKSLDEKYAEARRVPVWVVAPFPSLQVRFLSIPKSRPRQ